MLHSPPPMKTHPIFINFKETNKHSLSTINILYTHEKCDERYQIYMYICTYISTLFLQKYIASTSVFIYHSIFYKTPDGREHVYMYVR